MQKAETGILPAQSKLELTKLADVAIDKDHKIYVNWPVDKKDLVITGLAEAIKLVANYQSKVIKPDEVNQPSLMDFVKGVKKWNLSQKR